MADSTVAALTAVSSVAAADEVPISQSGAALKRATVTQLMAGAMGGASYTHSASGGTARTLQGKLEEAVSVTDFGATGNGTTDDTTAFTNALSTGKSVYVPPGNYRLTSGLTLSTSGQRLFGAGPWLSIIEWDGGSNNAITLADDQYMGIRALMIRLKSGASALTSGYAIAFARTTSNTFNCDVSDVLIYGMYNGILMRSVTEAIAREVTFWALTGAYGIRFDGTSGAPSYAATLDGVKFGGMSSNTSIILIDQNSYGYSMRMRKCVLAYGGTGFRMADDTASGTSYPLWCIGSGNECDHNDDYGVDLQAGEGFSWGESWIGSCLSGPGLATRSNWRGEATLTGTRVMGNKTHGISLAAGVDTVIVGNQIGDNSSGSSGTYHGINVAANLTRFTIVGNRIGDLIGVSGNAQGYGVNIAAGTSDYYSVTSNLLSGNTTGGISNGGTGSNQLVQTVGNAFEKVQIGDASFYALISSSNPAFNFDSNDVLAYSRSTNALFLNIASTLEFLVSASRLKVPAGIPTSASGLSSGDVWRDSAASNVLKMVP